MQYSISTFQIRKAKAKYLTILLLTSNSNSSSSSNNKTKQKHQRSRWPTLIGFLIAFGAVGFLYLGLPHVLPPSNISHGEKIAIHHHTSLKVVEDGKQVMIPENIGIDEKYYKDHSLDKYGVAGIAPVHTHDMDGMIHIESKVDRPFTLADFLNVWGKDFGNVKEVKVNGQSVEDYRITQLKDGDRLVLEVTH